MNKEDRNEIFKAINAVSCKVNDVSQKLDEVMQMLNASANEKISVNSGGIDGLADMVSAHDGAIEDLATIVAELEVKQNSMIDFYVYRIKNGLKKWTDVPSLWQEKVKDELIKQGYVLNDDGTVSKNE